MLQNEISKAWLSFKFHIDNECQSIKIILILPKNKHRIQRYARRAAKNGKNEKKPALRRFLKIETANSEFQWTRLFLLLGLLVLLFVSRLSGLLLVGR